MIRRRLRLPLLVLLALVPALAAYALESGWWEQRLKPSWELIADRDDRVLYSVESPLPRIALTIDDGPDAETTPAILDLLRAHGARVTFFLISGKIPGNESLVRRIVAEGHEIGNHMTADTPSIDLAPADFERRLSTAHASLSRFQAPRWFRPASGWYDEVMLDSVGRHGYRTALGNVYPLDSAVGFPGLSSRLVLWSADPGDVIVLHDGGARGRNTLHALERVLPELRRRGMEVVTLSRLAGEREDPRRLASTD